MNIPDFAKVLSAIIHHNVDIARQGGIPRDYLVPMAWGDPGPARPRSPKPSPTNYATLVATWSTQWRIQAAGR